MSDPTRMQRPEPPSRGRPQPRPGEPQPRMRAARPYAAPWQGPPPPRVTPRYDRSQLWLALIFSTAAVIICGIAAWFLADVIPG
jgi:hypothetical protein